MRSLVLSTVFLGVMAASSPTLPQGNGDFLLGMSRAQVDSAVAARGVAVISDGLAFLVCASDDPAVEYEQYSFFRAPHGADFLWRVTQGYRLSASREQFDVVRSGLVTLLGEPTEESADADDVPSPMPSAPPESRHAIWADPFTTVLLGARWTDAADRTADRMMVTWTDRRLQRQVEARRKKDRVSAAQ